MLIIALSIAVLLLWWVAKTWLDASDAAYSKEVQEDFGMHMPMSAPDRFESGHDSRTWSDSAVPAMGALSAKNSL